LYGQRLLQVRR